MAILAVDVLPVLTVVGLLVLLVLDVGVVVAQVRVAAERIQLRTAVVQVAFYLPHFEFKFD